MTLTLAAKTAVGAAEQGDKTEAASTSPTPDTQLKRVTGLLTHIEDWHYTKRTPQGRKSASA
jgi:hypothetical protein